MISTVQNYLCLLLIATVSTACGEENLTMSSPDCLKNTDRNMVHVGIILKILDGKDDISANFLDETDKMLTSMLQNTALRKMHLIVLTEERAVQRVSRLIHQTLARHIVSNLLRTFVGQTYIHPVPVLIIDYVRISDIRKSDPDFVDTLRANAPRELGKYSDILFFVAPVYHRAFKQLDKVIILDHDIIFVNGIETLWNEFKSFADSAVIGLAPELTPYYWGMTTTYRNTHPTDKRKFQGFNTGVAMYYLQKMRNSEKYNRNIESNNIFPLHSKYSYSPTVGDQDFFTAMSFQDPELFYNLPCQWNYQYGGYRNPDFEDIFEEYSACHKPWSITHSMF